MTNDNAAADPMVTAAKEAAERDIAHRIMMAQLHRMILAAGGSVTFALAEMPAEIPINLRVAHGRAIIDALPIPKKSGLVSVPAAFAGAFKG